MTHLRGVGVDVNDEFSVYNCIAKGVARISMVGEKEAVDLPVGIVAVNLRAVTGEAYVKWATDGGLGTYSQGKGFGLRYWCLRV